MNPGVATYARRIERELGRVAGRAVVLSPRDWTRVVDWHERGVPLALVLETLEEIAAARTRRRRGEPPRSLAAITAAVEEAWKVWCEGRVVGRRTDAPDEPPRDEAIRAWERGAAAAGDGPLGTAIGGLLAELAAGRDAVEVDRELDAALLRDAPAGPLARARRAAEQELAPWRERMAGEVFSRTRDRAVADRLRAELGLPRLALRSPLRD